MPKTMILTFFAVLVFAPTAQSAAYKWVDSSGQVHFSDTPPVSENFETIAQPRFAPPDKAAQQRLQQLIQSQEASRTARQNKSAEEKRQLAQKEARAKGCAQVREQFASYKDRPARRIAIENDDGSLRRMTEDEKQKRLQELREQMAELCDD